MIPLAWDATAGELEKPSEKGTGNTRIFQEDKSGDTGNRYRKLFSGGHRLELSMMELVSQASFSDAHEMLAIPLIAANMHRVIRPEQSQIWAVLHAGDSDSRIFIPLPALSWEECA
ncbi:MAG: hypothetical protein ACLUOI_28255 [Eisenbergiella sp.]